MLDDWLRIANSDDEVIMDRILTGSKPETFGPSVDVLEQFDLDVFKKLKILDFGCGMLRNTFWLIDRSLLWDVVAYDPVRRMIERGIFLKSRRCTTTFEFPNGNFDVIVAILVLQHIPKDELIEILKKLRVLCTGKLCVYSRRCLDNGEIIWPLFKDDWKVAKIFSTKNIDRELNLARGNLQDHSGVIFDPK